MRNSFIKIAIAAILLVLVGCGSAKDENSCITKSRQDVIISWGEYDMKNNQLIRGYAIKTDMTIREIYNLRDSVGVDTLAIADMDLYCDMDAKLMNTIIKVQKLNVPADTVRFVRYSNLATEYSLNGFWNNRLKAIGSKEYREVFGILNTISPIKFEE